MILELLQVNYIPINTERLRMKKFIAVVAWGVLLLVGQGNIMSMDMDAEQAEQAELIRGEEQSRQQMVHHQNIVAKKEKDIYDNGQGSGHSGRHFMLNEHMFCEGCCMRGRVSVSSWIGNIAEVQGVDAVVSASDFELNNQSGVSIALAKKFAEWNNRCQKMSKDSSYLRESGFYLGGHSRAILTESCADDDDRDYNSGHSSTTPKYIVNAVAPVAGSGDFKSLLKETYIDVFRAADKESITSIAIPAIGTGFFAKDRKGRVLITFSEAAKIAVGAMEEYFDENDGEGRSSSLERIALISQKGDAASLIANQEALGIPLDFQQKSQGAAYGVMGAFRKILSLKRRTQLRNMLCCFIAMGLLYRYLKK